jgi:hypothetical protein
MPERENAIHRTAETPVGPIEVARNNAPLSFHDAAHRGIVVRHVADRMRDRRKRGKDIPSSRTGQDAIGSGLPIDPPRLAVSDGVIVLAKLSFESVGDSSQGQAVLAILGVILAILIAAGWYAPAGLTSARHQCHRDDVG